MNYNFQFPYLAKHTIKIKICIPSAEVIDQKKKLSEIYKLIMELSSTDIKELMLTHCDMTCDICDAHFKSIQEAQYHYLHEHNIREGYIRCCSLKFKDIQRLNGHLVWHRHPDALRYSAIYFLSPFQ